MFLQVASFCFLGFTAIITLHEVTMRLYLILTFKTIINLYTAESTNYK